MPQKRPERSALRAKWEEDHVEIAIAFTKGFSLGLMNHHSYGKQEFFGLVSKFRR